MSNFNQAILTFSQQSVSTRVWAKDASGNVLPNASGECWDLAYEALRLAGANVPTTGHLYVWGSISPLTAAQPGDILQFRNFRIEIWVTLKDARGNVLSTTTSPATESRGAPHHTAILKSRNSQTGEVEIYEQNWGQIVTVASRSTMLEAKTITKVLPNGDKEETRTVTHGSLIVYRAR